MFSEGQQNASSAPAKSSYLALCKLAHLELNNYTGADSWLEARQTRISHDYQ